MDEGKWFRVNAVSLKHGAHASLGSILVFHDITEIKRLETMRSDFVANVSHELRTPLTAIRGYVETLLHRPPENPEDANYFLAIIERHSERLNRLIEDLLTLSDLESGKIQLAVQPVAAGQLIQRVLEVFWAQADAKKHGLSHGSTLRRPCLPRHLLEASVIRPHGNGLAGPRVNIRLTGTCPSTRRRRRIRWPG